MKEVLGIYLGLADSQQIKTLIVLTLFYFFLSIVVAIKDRKGIQYLNFSNTLDNALVPLYGGLSLMVIIAASNPGWSSYVPAMWGILDLAVLGLMATKGKSLGLDLSSISIPFLKR